MGRTSQARGPRPTRAAPSTTTNTDPLSGYGDHSSNYWPAGWNFAKWRVASMDDIHALPESELEKMQAGFLAQLGEDGFSALVEKRFAAGEGQEAQNATDQPAAPNVIPAWLQTYQQRFAQCETWGLVVFRTTVDNNKDKDSEQRWDDFKGRFEQTVRMPFTDESDIPGVAEAAAKFTIRWVEDDGLVGADVPALQRTFDSLDPSPTAGFPSNLILAVTPRSIKHLLSTEFSPGKSNRFRSDPPYILAVAPTPYTGPSAPSVEAERYKECFRAAVETLVDELWFMRQGLDQQPWEELSMYVQGVDLAQGEDFEGHRDGEEGDEKDKELAEVWWSSLPPPGYRKRKRATN